MNDFIESKVNEEIDIFELVTTVWKQKLLVSCITFAFSLIAILISLQLPNIYKSEALLSPANSGGSVSGMLGQYSGLASMAGISLPGSSGADNTAEAIERIKSFTFYERNILPNINLADLMAAEKWIPSTDTIVYKKNEYDKKSSKWTRNVSYPRTIKPSAQESHQEFLKILSVNHDKQTSFVTISIEHVSPNFAKNTLDLIVFQINNSMQNNERQRTEKSIEFLNIQLGKTNYEEVKQSIASLQEDQLKSLMLLEADKEYVFKMIDFPISPELKFKPQRSIIVILSTIIGFIFAVIYSLARKKVFNK